MTTKVKIKNVSDATDVSSHVIEVTSGGQTVQVKPGEEVDTYLWQGNDVAIKELPIV